MALPDTRTSVTRAQLGQILRDLGLDPRLTIAVQITSSQISAQVVALDGDGVLIRSSGDSVIHDISIPVEGAETVPEPTESP